MSKRIYFSFAVFFILLFSHAVYAEERAAVKAFSPQGISKDVRQVRATFSEQMVAFGEVRASAPFEVNCSRKGNGVWIDTITWVYNFEQDLPGGIACEFVLRDDLKTLSGRLITGQRRFSFSTGGPSVREIYPNNESEGIDERQVFILTLDAEATDESIASSAFCMIAGINERVGAHIMKGPEREKMLKAFGIKKDDGVVRALLQCKQAAPSHAKVTLVWGKGITSQAGIATNTEQTFSFKTRAPFTAYLRCQRENPRSDCIPLLPLHLEFSAPISSKYVPAIVLRGDHQKVYKAVVDERGDGDGFIRTVFFKGPFPERSSFFLEVPKDIRDDAGRTLSNKAQFPLTVRTAPYPPLAKFSARFGIIERRENALLPVTVRDIEQQMKGRLLEVGSTPGTVQEIKGKMYAVGIQKDTEIIDWLRRVASTGRSRSVFRETSAAREFSFQKPGGSKAFEVVGIPLKAPGLTIVEIESRVLGLSLLGESKPMYVPTAALVTNLSAHFKWGRDASLVWVTTLDKAGPVENVLVTIRDCKGKALWEGKTDADGVATIKKRLPSANDLPRCQLKMDEDISYDYAQLGALTEMNSGLFVFARTTDDVTFVHSGWDKGIEPWRFGLPEGLYQSPVIAHTVFDRSLLRAGETLSMKHFIRRQIIEGFSLPSKTETPEILVIQHMGSDQSYEMPLRWDQQGISETTWKIPRDARLGQYEVSIVKRKGSTKNREDMTELVRFASGSFRVGEFRVPFMRGILYPPDGHVVNTSEVEIGLSVAYLSGGGAANAPVKVRSQIQPRQILFEGYEGFQFVNGTVKEGIVSKVAYEYEEGDEGEARVHEQKQKMQSLSLSLDQTGSARATLRNVPKVMAAQTLSAELEFRDPNGEAQTVSTRIPIYPSRILVGIKAESWTAAKKSFTVQLAAVDLSGQAAPNRAIQADVLQKKYYSHRKRLIGGFYAYEHITEIKRIGQICEGVTDNRGFLNCEIISPVSGNIIIQAQTSDDQGSVSAAHFDMWIADRDEWWFDVADSDRIDIIPEKRRYEPGETARFQVRMPFKEATALVTVEREGVIEHRLTRLSGTKPVIEIPVRQTFAPNVFISVMCVRGRIGGVTPTAMVDLGKPSFKVGVAEIIVGWRAYELKVAVTPDRPVYRVRETAKVKVRVSMAEGRTPPAGSEVAIAAVDEGLLELMPNKSWDLLQSMMARRGYGIATSTAQMQVVGKRHFGLKALPHGGGGGKQATRELFDTLLLWKGRVALDEKGEATVDIPLNDSLTSFRIVAVANGGLQLFGTGQTSIRTTQDLMLMAGLPQVVREGDWFKALFTIRNGTERGMTAEVRGTATAGKARRDLEGINLELRSGESKEVTWDIEVPMNSEAFVWEVSARGRMQKQYEGKSESFGNGAQDSIKITQRIISPVPVRSYQAVTMRVSDAQHMEVARPHDALSQKGGIAVSLVPSLLSGAKGVIEYMKQYPYTCLEQRVSRAVALRDLSLWRDILAELPALLDADGMVKYFPSQRQGSDSLTSYVLSISHEAGWSIPVVIKEKMEAGLVGFVEGRIARHSLLSAPDLLIRKMAALAALSRFGKAEPRHIGALAITPHLWPTSAVIDWIDILLRVQGINDRERRLAEAEQVVKSRITYQGTMLLFSTEKNDSLWWLMTSPDVNAVKSILTFVNLQAWKDDMPRLVRGAVARQQKGMWSSTIANAWGILALERFSEKFEAFPPAGKTVVRLGTLLKEIDWGKNPGGGSLFFGWPSGKEQLSLAHEGSGSPWLVVQSLAAIPLREPVFSGYTIKKTFVPIEQSEKGKWNRGDIVRVRLEITAQADMTWVVMNDPIPAGASILGRAFRQGAASTSREEKTADTMLPTFEEKAADAYRAYIEFFPKGTYKVEYAVRFNTEGLFLLPATRIEALYSPEMLGEMPNKSIEIH